MQTMTTDELRTQLRISVDIIDSYVAALVRKDKTILSQNERIEELELSVKNYRELLFPEIPNGGEGSE